MSEDGAFWTCPAPYAEVRRFNCPVGTPTSCNINGGDLPFAPKFKLYANAAYRFAVSDGLQFELQSDISFRTETQYNLSQTAHTTEPAYAIWNASAALLFAPGNSQLRLFVKNFGNESYSSFLQNGSAAGSTRFVPRDDRRYAGILLRKDF